MEFSLEDLFAEPPPKISGRPKKEEGKQGQGSYRSGLASLYSSLKRNDKDIVQEAPVAEEHVISPTKKLSKFHSQQEQRTNLDCDSGSLRDLFIEPPQKTSIKVVCPSANHNGSLDKEQNNAPLVELQKGKIGPCHDETGMQSNTEVASTTKGIAEVQIGRKVENVDELNICESELKQNDSKAKSVAPFPNIKSPSSSLSSEKRNLNSLEMNENVEEKAQRINEDKRTLEENILKKLKKTPSYHVPSLDEILGKSPMTTNIAKRSSFSLEDELKFLKKPRKETRSDLQQGKVTSDQNKNYSTDQPTIGEEFRKHFLEKKKWKDKPKVKVTEYDGCTENQFTISKQEIEGNSKNSSIMKKKAGNYLRKLHTKCRVSRKELQMLETKTVDDETDFFAEAIDRPEIAKSQQNTEITEYPYISFKKDVFAEGQVIVKSAAQRRKERKNKKRKAKKKRNRLKGVNNDANSQNSDDDDDEIILLPRKDTKPHKWPVRTKSIEQQKMQPETELGLKKEISTKDDSKRELTNESIGNQKEIVVRKRLDNASGPSLLDEIISQSATLYPGYPASSLQPSEIETQTKVDLSRFSRSAQPKTSLSGDSAGFSKLRFGENWKGTKDLNRTEMNQWWKKSSLEESKNVLNKQNIAGNIRKDDKEHLLGVDSCKQLSTTHPTLEKSAKITTEGKQQEKVISDKKMGSCLENSLIKEDNTAGDNLNDISMKEILNQELKEKSSLNIAIENARKEVICFYQSFITFLSFIQNSLKHF